MFYLRFDGDVAFGLRDEIPWIEIRSDCEQKR